MPHSFSDLDSSGWRVLSRDAAIALGRKLLGLLKDTTSGISIEHTARAVTKVANGMLLNTDDGDRANIAVRAQFHNGMPVYIRTNQLNDETLRRFVARAEEMAPPKPPADQIEPDDPNDQINYTLNQRDFTPVSLWHDPTVRAMETVRGDVIPNIVQQLRSSKLMGAATVGLMSRSTLHIYRHGLTAFAEETDCEVTVTARTPDGAASGWSGQAHRNWTKLSPDSVVRDAVELANRSRNMVAVEPGRKVAILGPAAVAQLVREMAYLFDANLTYVFGDIGTPFTFMNRESEGRRTKVGMQVFDPRITMVSDPADPDGGYPPFFEAFGTEASLLGYPTPAATWIDRGVLKQLAYDVGGALGRRVSPSNWPTSVRLVAAPGTKTATVEDMIANCKEGVYVNRFSDTALMDYKTGMMTGVTRDGCFLVRNGKIDRPIKNFRFLDSPFFSFNSLEMIGTPERVAFGYNAPPGRGQWLRWPQLPIIVPPMMIRDFNFASLADAV